MTTAAAVPADAPVRAVVVTVVAGRHDHLRAQRRGLARVRPAVEHVVVAMGDDGVAAVVAEQPDLASRVVTMPAGPAGLPLAAARNRGADEAVAAGAELIVFLDVDCLPGPDLVARYAAAAGEAPGALLCGPATYLPPGEGWTDADLAAHRSPHPARPDPPAGVCTAADPELFWSLSFAVHADTWAGIDHFYEGYVGYGGEDTDFARCAARAGTPMVWVGGADAFHQHHETASPPRQHLDDIVRNASLFAARHGDLPMRGWLDAFDGLGLVERHGDVVRRRDAVSVASIPAHHPYVQAVLPPTAREALPGRTTSWEPDPLLDPDHLAACRDRIDVVHAHFGLDHLEPAALQAWLAELDRLDLPLVHTVHDLRNPHHGDRARHDAALALLVRAAAHLITLTEGAADECARRFGRRPEVVAHPTLLRHPAPMPPGGTGPPVVLVPLKAMRPNIAEAPRLVDTVRRAAAGHGARTHVLLHPGPADGTLPAAPGLRVDVRPHLPEAELVELLSAAHAVVLPYRFGTHSGLLELCRDLGTPVIAPSCGHYADQWPDVIGYGNDETTGLDADSLGAAVRRALGRPRFAPAAREQRLAARDVARGRHDVLYRQLARR